MYIYLILQPRILLNIFNNILQPIHNKLIFNVIKSKNTQYKNQHFINNVLNHNHKQGQRPVTGCEITPQHTLNDTQFIRYTAT